MCSTHLERAGLLCCGTGAERDDSVLHTQSGLAYSIGGTEAERDDHVLHTQSGLAYSVVGRGQREMIVF